MDRAVAAACRRRGVVLVRNQLVGALTRRRIWITVLVGTGATVLSLIVAFVPDWAPRPAAMPAPVLAVFGIAVGFLAAWACIATWFRRDRGRAFSPSALQSGELTRLMSGPETGAIPNERRDAVATAIDGELPGLIARAFSGLAGAAISLLLFLTGLTFLVAGGGLPSGMYPWVVVFPINVAITRSALLTAGRYDHVPETLRSSSPSAR